MRHGKAVDELVTEVAAAAGPAQTLGHKGLDHTQLLQGLETVAGNTDCPAAVIDGVFLFHHYRGHTQPRQRQRRCQAHGAGPGDDDRVTGAGTGELGRSAKGILGVVEVQRIQFAPAGGSHDCGYLPLR